jgi:TPR repeat protein/serine/threonine protein kinase
MPDSSANNLSPVPTGRPTQMVLPGQVAPGSILFGRYRLESELGRGGFGVVWLAHDNELGIEVALKFLPDLVARDPEAIEDLKREIRRGLKLTHPGIVRVHNFIRDPELAAIAMEYIDGTTLRQRKLDSPGRCIDADELRPIVAQLCDVLTYVHEAAKLVHRDLKPGNLMLTSAGEVKVADFGIAGSLADSLTRMTNTHSSGGTLAYMSPQQARGEPPTVTDDIYALGATLYELLTGKPPFYRGDIVLQASEIIPPPMSQRRVELGALEKKPIPPEWERVIAACLAKVPQGRPQSTREVRDALLTIAAPAPRRPPQLPAVGALPPPMPSPAPPLPIERAFDSQRSTPTATAPTYYPPPAPTKRFPLWPFAIAAVGVVVVCAWFGWRLADSETPASPHAQNTDQPVKPRPSTPAPPLKPNAGADEYYREGLAFENGAGHPIDATQAAANYQRATDLGQVAATARLARLLNYGWGVRQDEGRALQLAEQAAAQGDPFGANLAAFILGSSRHSGSELARSIAYLERAVSGGYALAMFNLADRLRTGTGVAKDETRAEDLDRRGVAQLQADAAAGQAEAHYWLGWARAQGRGAPRDLQSAVRSFETGVQLGHPRSMVALGDAYASGQGVPEDNSRAAELYRRAADTGWLDALIVHAGQLSPGGHLSPDPQQAKTLLEQAITRGSLDALWRLGELLYDNPIVRDEPRAVTLLRQATDANDSEAWWRLGLATEQGRGTAQSDAEAFRCYLKSASQNNRIGQLYTGRCLRTGKGASLDPPKAREWFERASSAGLFAAMCDLAEMLRDGVGGPRDLPRATRLFATAANGGFAWGQFQYGWACESGAGMDKDETQAVSWYEKAAAQNLPAAQAQLGAMLLSGRGTEKNVTRGAALIRTAAETGNALGQVQLGYCYESGTGVAQDYREAFQWFTRAAAQGVPGAQLELGWFYHNGYGCTRDYNIARSWYEKAAALGNARAFNNLGVLYQGGLGVKASRTKAIECYQRGASAGDELAAKNLRTLGAK